MSYPLILRLDINGLPVNWIHWQEAACLYASDRVAWTAGENVFPLRGGFSRNLERQTLLYIHSIIATKGEYRRYRKRSEERRVGKECRSRWSPDH